MGISDETPLKVTLFGRFSLSIPGGPAVFGGQNSHSGQNGRSKKVWLLMAYLICARGRLVPREELSRLLWPGEKRPGNPANAVKTIFYRARAFLDQLYEGAGERFLHSGGGGYAWSSQPPVDVDLDRFLRLCGQTDSLDSLLMGAELFKDGFLPKLQTESPWAKDKAKEFLNIYIKAVNSALPLLEEAGRLQELVALCEKAATLAPLEAQLYTRRMSALMALERPSHAARVYEDMRQVFLALRGVMPPEDAGELYRRVRSRHNGSELPLGDILCQLSEEPAHGAYFCEYDVFCALYRLQSRDCARSGHSLCLCVIAAASKQDGIPLSRRSLDLVMDNLRSLIPPLLRGGDALARCSASQYLILLPRAGYEGGRLACDRICRAFARQYPHSPAVLKTVIFPGGGREAENPVEIQNQK